MKSKTIPAVIGSPELRDGTMPCNSQDGLMTDQYGQPACPANHSLWRGGKKRNGTIDIFGPSSTISFENADLSPSLANKLKLRLDSAGSTVYAQTWIERATPLGLLYWAHTVSGHRTSGNGYSGWPTTRANDAEKRGETAINPRNGLVSASQIAGYPTPRADEFSSRQEGTGGKVLKEVAGGATVRVSGFNDNTRAERVARGTAHCGDSLEIMAGWATPTGQDAENDAGPSQFNRQTIPLNTLVHGVVANTSNAPTEKRGSLNPAFALWLMGFPIAWAHCAEQVTRLSRKSRRSS